MGLFRFFLAFNVFLGHFSINTHVPAVESFFVMSGFYMSLVLNEKYIGKKKSYLLFVRNRFLRIYPSYYAVLVLFVLFFLVNNQLQISISLSSFFKVLENVTLITNLKYFFPLGNYTQNLIDAPAWSLGIEMIFYLIAPFILRSKKLVFGALLLTFVLNRLFIPAKFFEVFYLFFLGAISYLIYLKFKKTKLPGVFKSKFLIYFLLFLAATFIIILVPVFPHFEGIIQKIYYLGLVALIPFVFKVTSKLSLDKFLGDLSYPIYICHAFILLTLGAGNIILSAILVLILSILIYRFIDKPIQQYKAKNTGSLRLKLLGF